MVSIPRQVTYVKADGLLYYMDNEGTEYLVSGSAEQITDITGGMFTGNTETFIVATFQDADNTVDLVVPVLDEDNLATDSAVHLATQQSIKAYVDTAVAAIERELVASKPSGDISVETALHRLYNKSGNARTITRIGASVEVAPTGASIKLDVNIDGTTAFTTQANQPTIAISGFESTETAPDVTAWADGEWLEIDVDQVGSTEPGEGLVVHIFFTEA